MCTNFEFVQYPGIHFLHMHDCIGINIYCNILQDLKVPKKDGGSRRGSFNPDGGGGDDMVEVSNMQENYNLFKFLTLRKTIIHQHE